MDDANEDILHLDIFDHDEEYEVRLNHVIFRVHFIISLQVMDAVKNVKNVQGIKGLNRQGCMDVGNNYGSSACGANE